jgi:hypothetical protein
MLDYSSTGVVKLNVEEADVVLRGLAALALINVDPHTQELIAKVRAKVRASYLAEIMDDGHLESEEC